LDAGRNEGYILAGNREAMTEADASTHEDSVASERRQAKALHAPYLFLVFECDRPASGGARYALAGIDEVAIGRGSQRRGMRQRGGGRTRLDVRVPGRSMSASHARLRPCADGWILEDTGSTNGSFVNGYRINEAVVGDGDIIELGHTLFLLRSGLSTTSSEANELDSADLASEPPGFATLLPPARQSLRELARVAASPLPILLLGQSGTGKEVIARSVHELSRPEGPFIAVNCGALPTNLVESQLFGHTKGAFSGAVRDAPGALRSAEGGTILLDEIGDLPRTSQPALLRFLQEREVTPVGDARPIRVDVRVIAATNQPLADLVEAGEFRADLLARLSGFVHTLPDLRSRREDLGVIVANILVKHGLHERPVTITPAAGRRLLTHRWPANIRELESAIVRAMTLADREQLDENHFLLDAIALPAAGTDAPSEQDASRVMSEADAKLRGELIELLETHGGNVADVARALGRARMQIYRWLKRLDVDADRFRR
jgi:DNA-binding NtrC family response regulator